jgi:hypothetical protein
MSRDHEPETTNYTKVKDGKWLIISKREITPGPHYKQTNSMV